MLKRILISLFLVIILLVGVILGASLLFSGGHSDGSPGSSPETAEMPSASPAPADPFPQQVQPAEPTPENADASAALPVEEAEPTPAAPATPESLLAGMTLEEKICQRLFVTPEALTGYGQVTTCGSATWDALGLYPVGGVIYFGANLEHLEQTRNMLLGIQSYSLERTGIGLFLGVDEEGGTVARLADNLGTAAFEDMRVYGQQGDPQAAYDIGTQLAETLTDLGFNLDFAPVADVYTNEDNTVVKDRSFGSDPGLVASMVAEEVRGLQEHGVMAVPKHFPGHGSTGGDTHDGFAASDRTQEELDACDLVPFRAAMEQDASMIMVGHMTMMALDEDNPASLSRAIVTDLLRQAEGYEGVIITDAMNMGAIMDLYSYGEATVAAFAAGCDMVLCVNDLDQVVAAVTEAVAEGRLTEADMDASVLRILRLKQAYGLLQ